MTKTRSLSPKLLTAKRSSPLRGAFEANLTAELAQILLGAPRLQDALSAASESLARALGLSWASVRLGEVEPGEGLVAFPLGGGSGRVGTLLVPAEVSATDRAAISERVVPPLESILAAAEHRSQLQAEVVETDALRRSDEMKTAILRSVSHDLRTPITAILTAAAALDPAHPTTENVADVRELVTTAASRLARLVEKLLDLSLLQAGDSAPRSEWLSIEEVLQEAIEEVLAPSGPSGDEGLPQGEAIKLSCDPLLPLLHGDSSQLERAFANLLENALRHCAGKPVLVRARAVGSRVRVRVVDQGPGIPDREQQRVFLPFYRAAGDDPDHQGSGLGLAIAKGFIEAAGGSVTVESSPPHGTSFVVELPIPPQTPGAVAGGRPAGVSAGERAAR